LSNKLEKAASIQEKLAELGDPQVELHLICLGVVSVFVRSHTITMLGSFSIVRGRVGGN